MNEEAKDGESPKLKRQKPNPVIGTELDQINEHGVGEGELQSYREEGNSNSSYYDSESDGQESDDPQ